MSEIRMKTGKTYKETHIPLNSRTFDEHFDRKRFLKPITQAFLKSVYHNKGLT